MLVGRPQANVQCPTLNVQCPSEGKKAVGFQFIMLNKDNLGIEYWALDIGHFLFRFEEAEALVALADEAGSKKSFAGLGNRGFPMMLDDGSSSLRQKPPSEC